MKKSSIILSLLTLTAALVSLPALGDLNYLKNGYTYIEKIPVKSISSNINQSKIGNLTDDKNSTEWTSWEEYEQTYPESYKDFIDFDVDGNPHRSGIGNSQLGFNDGILTYVRYPEDNNANKGSRVLTTTNDNIDIVRGVEYQVVTHLTSSKAGELTMRLGDQTATAVLAGTGEEEEVVFNFEPYEASQNSAICEIEADLYTGSLNILDAKLVSPKPLASTYPGEWKVLDVIDGTPIVNANGNLVAEQARHFKIIDGLSINREHTYRITTRIKVDGPNDYPDGGKVIVNFGTWGNGNTYNENSKYLNLTNQWQELSVEFVPDLENPDKSILKDATQDWASIYCWDNGGNPKACKSNILVDWVEVYDVTTGTVVKKEDYETKTVMSDWNEVPNPTVIDNSDAENGKVLYSACPAFHFRVLSGLSLDKTQNYTVKIKLQGSSNPSETVFVNLGDYGNGRTYGKSIAVTPVMSEYTINFESTTLPQNPTSFCSIYCPNASGKITVESVELFGGDSNEIILGFNTNMLEKVAPFGTWGGGTMAQFSILRGINLQPNKSYMVTARVKASSKTNINIVIGSDEKTDNGLANNLDSWSTQKSKPFPTEWEEIQFLFSTDDLHDAGHDVKTIKEVRLQPLNYVGKIEIEKVTIYPVADVGVTTYAVGDDTKTLPSQLNDGSAAGEGYIKPSNNGTTLYAPSTSVPQKFYVFKDIELPAGTYTMTGTYSAQGNGKINVYFGNAKQSTANEFYCRNGL